MPEWSVAGLKLLLSLVTTSRRCTKTLSAAPRSADCPSSVLVGPRVPTLARNGFSEVISETLRRAVLGVRNGSEVGYVAAGPMRALGAPFAKAAFGGDVARVVNVKAIGYRPNQQFVDSPVAIDQLSVDADDGVPALRSGLRPRVAFIGASGRVKVADDSGRIQALPHAVNLIQVESRGGRNARSGNE